jgi:hypothetical protein
MALDWLHREHGVPAKLITDHANELVAGEFRRKALAAGSQCLSVEPYTQQHNRAELAIRELKRGYRRQMRKTNAPRVLWDHCLQLQAMIRSHTALDLYELYDEVPETNVSGDTADISALVEHAWYDWVWYLNPPGFDMEIRELGRWLGPSHDVGQAMCSKIFTKKATILNRSSVFPISPSEWNSDVVKQQMSDFEDAVKLKLRDNAAGVQFDMLIDDEVEFDTPEYDRYMDNDGNIEPTMPEADDFDHDAFDKYIASQVVLPTGDNISYGKVIRRKRDNDGNLIG